MSRRTLAVAVMIGFISLFQASSPVAQEAWERIALLGLDTRALAVDENHDVLFAGTTLGVWRSLDNGTTWEQSLDSPALAHAVVADLVVANSADGTVFAVTEDGFVFRSTDAALSPGFTFQKIKNQSPEKSKATSLAVDPRYDGSGTYDTLFLGTLGEGTYYTSDATNAIPTWTADTGGQPLLDVYDLATGLNGSTLLLFLGGTGNNDGPLFRRNNAGSYSNISMGVGAGGAGELVTTLLALPANPTNTLWAGTATHGLYKTTNATSGSVTWSASCDGTCSGTVCTGTAPRVNALARSSGSTPYFLEGRDDAPRWSADDAATCADLPFRGIIQAVAFQRSYNGTSRCYVFFGTPAGLFRKVQGTCTTAVPKRGPEIVDGYAVALAGDGAGKFMGSLSGGLFKSVVPGIQPGNMVRYNNFPNKKTPQIVAVCLPKDYNEFFALTGDGCGTYDELMVFVAANFPDAPGDNGVYRSTDWGNTWVKMTGGSWPAGTVWMNDLAISPNFDLATGETTLFAATSRGLYRWDGDTPAWTGKFTSYPVYAVGLPPNYDFGTSFATVFISTDNGTLNQVQKSNDSGNTWTDTGYSAVGTPRGRVTGFAFPKVYSYANSNVYVSATTAPSTQTGVTGGIYRYYYSLPFWYWQSKTPTIAGASYAWDIAAEPDFQNGSGKNDLYLATDGGLLKSTDASSTWNVADPRPAFSIVYDCSDLTGAATLAGFQGRTGYAPDDYGVAIQDGETSSRRDFWGYHFLPDDVWASVAHERDTDILFSSSPSMGVFVSEDKGLSFRPWNRGLSDQGPCVVRSGLGINMLAARRASAQDVVWVGTDGDGIKARTIYYDSTTGQVDLETENGSVSNGWRHGTWLTGGGSVTGRWERIEVTPNAACSYPVWATSPALGMASLQGDLAACEYYRWKLQNSGLASLAAKGVRQGYQSLQSGVPVNGESVLYHQWNYYQVQVPSGTADLRVVLDDLDDGGSMDPDLYVRHGALPTLDIWDYRPYINGDETVCVNPSSGVLLNENFTSLLTEAFTTGIPGTWTVVDGGSGGGAAATWTTANPGGRTIGAPFSAPFAIVDSDYAGNGATQDESLITPALNCSAVDQVVLLFDNQFHWISGYGNDVATVDVSTNGGGSWTNALTMTGADDPNPLGANTKSVDLTALAAGMSSVKVRFRYTGAYDFWWAIDTVRVYGVPKSWAIQHNGAGTGPSSTWSVGNPCSATTLGGPMSPPYAVADTTCSGGGVTYQEYLKSPSFDASAYSRVTLTFDYQFTDAGPGASLRVYGSTDGGVSWYGWYNIPGNASPGPYTLNLSSFMAGKANCVIRFAYFDDATAPGGWAAIDNIQVTGQGPKPGYWYIGVYGFANTTNTYNLTATLNSGCTPLKVDPDPKPRPEPTGEGGESAPWPEAPSTSSTWGTVSGSGVYKGTGSASATEAVTWVLRNGTTFPLTNTLANSVVQLSDLTVIAGCDGDVFYSPAPDEGTTTWVNATANVASAGSNDFRDLLVSSNGDVLLAANGTGAGTNAGGVWLSGDKGAHWMRLSTGFDADSQELTDLMADSGSPPSYYASTGATGEYTRTITADPYPTVTGVNPSSGPATGGTTVTITGTGFLGTCPTGTANDCPSPNDKPVVLFGDTEVASIAWSATSITCTTPPQAVGAVKVTVRNPDTRRSSTGPTYTYTCSAPSAPVITTCADLSTYDFTGIRVEWSLPASWGDSTETSRSQSFYRDGIVNTSLAWNVIARTDNPAIRNVLRSYRIRAVNSCGLSADSGTSTATDDAEAGAYSTSARALKWYLGGKTQLDWGDMTGETSYTLYRGSGSSVADLATEGGASVCTAYTGAIASTGAILSASPSSGQFYWYLVTASAGTAEGTLGTGSGGSARKVASSGACGTP